MHKLTHINTSLVLEATILTPIHIGAGKEKNWIRGLDYFIHGKSVLILDKNKLLEQLVAISIGRETAMDRYLQLLSANTQNYSRIENLIKDQLRLDLTEYVTHQFSLEKLDMGKEGRLPQEIKSLTRDGYGNTYIPGSSIKGALRSILFNYLFREFAPSFSDRKTIHNLLGDFAAGIMHYILPSDLYMEHTELAIVELFNLRSIGSRWESFLKQQGGFPLWIESFATDTESAFKFSIASGLANWIEKNNSSLLPRHLRQVIPIENPIQFLFNLANDYTHRHVQREIAFFQKYDQAPDTDQILEQLDFLLKETTGNQRSCVLRLAFGSGFHGMTGDWRFSDHLSTIDHPDRENMVYNFKVRSREPARYKSRRIADNGQYFAPMGFLRLELPEAAENINFSPQIKL